MFERFTHRARRVLVLAQEEARLLNHNFIEPEHILLGLIEEGDGIAAQALAALDISLDAVREGVEERVKPGGGTRTGSPPFTRGAKKVLELSLREALQLGHNYIGTEHMLLGLLRAGDGVATEVLVSLGADLLSVREQLIMQLSGYKERERVADTGGGSRPAAPLSAIAPHRVGTSFTLGVVRAGRLPGDFAEAHEELSAVLSFFDRDPEVVAGRIDIESVDTTE